MSKGGNPFAFPENIDNEAKKLFTQLKEDNFLQDLLAKNFAEKSAHFLAELNVIHAFREGNGRTQLSFFLLLAEQANHPIDLHRFDPDAFLDAMIASFQGDEAPLAAIIEKLVE
jgi:cell filamentation protein